MSYYDIWHGRIYPPKCCELFYSSQNKISKYKISNSPLNTQLKFYPVLLVRRVFYDEMYTKFFFSKSHFDIYTNQTVTTVSTYGKLTVAKKTNLNFVYTSSYSRKKLSKKIAGNDRV